MTTTSRGLVEIRQTLTKRWVFVHANSGRTSNGHWASKRLAREAARRNGFEVEN